MRFFLCTLFGEVFQLAKFLRLASDRTKVVPIIVLNLVQNLSASTDKSLSADWSKLLK